MKYVKGIILKSKVIILVSIALIGFGFYSYIVMPKQEMPDMSPPIGSYQIIAPGFSASELYENVVEPIEEAIEGVSEIEDIISNTYDSFAVITVIMDINEVDADSVWIDVNKEIDTVILPDNVSDPTFLDMFYSPHAVYSVTSETKDILAVEEMADIFADKIRKMSSIKNVMVQGGASEYLEVKLNVEELNKLSLTVSNISDILRANGMNIPVGELSDGQDDIGVEVPMLYKDIRQLEDIAVSATVDSQGVPKAVTLADIADIEVKTETMDKKIYADGKQAMFLSVSFVENLDYTRLGDKLEAVADQFDEENQDYDIGVLSFMPDAVDDSIDQVNNSLIQGVIFVLIIILLGLGLRNALSVAFTFPMIIFTTILCIYALGVQLQMISIAGLIITIGIIVDNSIVISEAIQHHLDEGHERKLAIAEALKENATPVLASTLTTIAAFIPLMMLPGATGKMMFALPMTVVIAISLSYVIAMMVTPVLGNYLYKPKKEKKKPAYIDILNRGVNASLKHPVLIILASVALFVGAMVLLMETQPFVLATPSEESIVYIDYEYTGEPEEMSVEEYAKSIMDAVETYDDLEYTAYSVGGDLPRFDMAAMSLSELPTLGKVYLRFDVPYKQIPAIMKDIELKLEPMRSHGIITVHELLMGMDTSDIQVLVESENIDEAAQGAEKIEQVVMNMAGIESYDVGYPTYQDKFLIELDRDTLASYGAIAMDIQMQVRNYLSAMPSGDFEHDGEKIPIKLYTDVEKTSDLEEAGIMIQSMQEKVMLEDLGEMTEAQSIFSILSFNGLNQVSISAKVAEGYETAAVQAMVDEEIAKIDLGEAQITNMGFEEQMNEILVPMGIAAIVAILLIFLIMMMQFNSFKQPFIVLATIPLSLIGSAIALVIVNEGITDAVMLGVIALMGIVVNSGILLIDYINRARKEGIALKEACYQAVGRRIRPITLSSVTTIFGLLPLALYGGLFFAPMAVALIGGLAVATLMTIFVIPAMYFFIERKKEPAS
jgi:multidrug efflux pump